MKHLNPPVTLQALFQALLLCAWCTSFVAPRGSRRSRIPRRSGPETWQRFSEWMAARGAVMAGPLL